MGLTLPKCEFRVIVLGLHGSGKTTMLLALQERKAIKETMPSIPFLLKTLRLERGELIGFNIGGRNDFEWKMINSALSPLGDFQGVLYVVDASNRETLEEDARQIEFLSKFLTDRPHIPVAFCLNKADISPSLDPADFEKACQLHSDAWKCREWTCLPTSAGKKTGLREALRWVLEHSDLVT